MTTRLNDFKNCISLEAHLDKCQIEMGDEEYEVFELVVLLLHQSSHLVTYCEGYRNGSRFIFKEQWLKSLTQTIKPSVDDLESFSEEFLYAGDGVFDCIRGGLRTPVDEWTARHCNEHNKKLHKILIANARVVQEKLALPLYKRATLHKKTGVIKEEFEFPGWLFRSVYSLV